jgi:hypothetical protein
MGVGGFVCFDLDDLPLRNNITISASFDFFRLFMGIFGKRT